MRYQIWIVVILTMSTSLSAQNPLDIPRCQPAYRTCHLYCDSPAGPQMNNGHIFTEISKYPFTEDITNSSSAPIATPVTITGPTQEWTVIQSGCAEAQEFNIRASVEVHLLLAAYVEVSGALGTNYEVRLTIDGGQRGHYQRIIRPKSGSSTRQGDHFNGVAPKILPGFHIYRLEARIPLDTGPVTFHTGFITAQGVPALEFHGQTLVEDPPVQLGAGQGISTTPIVFTPATDVEALLGGYVKIRAGAPGHRLEVGFTIDGVFKPGTLIYIPAHVQAGKFDAVNVFDWSWLLPKLNQHQISFTVRSPDGPVEVELRQNQLVAFERRDAPAAILIPGIFEQRLDAAPVTVSTTSTDAAPRFANDGCGNWTEILRITIPPNPPGAFDNFSWVGNGYIEITGNFTGDWSSMTASSAIQYAIDVTAGDGNFADFHWVADTVPVESGSPTKTHIYLFADALLWGNYAGNTVRLVMRKMKGCGYATGDASFQVGLRQLALKLVPVDAACHVIGPHPGTCPAPPPGQAFKLSGFGFPAN